MTLIALLLLYPTPLVHPWGLDHTIPGDHITRAVAPVIRDQRSVFSPANPSGGAECEDEEWGDGEGAEALLGWPALPRPFRQDDLPSHLPSSPVVISPSLRSLHLRC
jgi:hypothetical protein